MILNILGKVSPCLSLLTWVVLPLSVFLSQDLRSSLIYIQTADQRIELWAKWPPDVILTAWERSGWTVFRLPIPSSQIQRETLVVGTSSITWNFASAQLMKWFGYTLLNPLFLSFHHFLIGNLYHFTRVSFSLWHPVFFQGGMHYSKYTNSKWRC